MLSTTKVEYSLFSELDESITLIFIVCLWQPLVEHVSYAMIY